jgi:hypothetical protein
MMTKSPFLVYVFGPPNDFMLPPPPWQTVLLKFPFRGFHLFVLWFRVTVMMRFVFSALRFLVLPHAPIPLIAVADALLSINIDLLRLLLPSPVTLGLFQGTEVTRTTSRSTLSVRV